jgi:trehalose synthase
MMIPKGKRSSTTCTMPGWGFLAPSVPACMWPACQWRTLRNSAIVNALQRRADVIVQKSLAEGFGLTVTEAMWKARPIVATSVGGIQDQITHGRTGLLIDDPQDLSSFGRAVERLLQDRQRAQQMGAQAHQRVCDAYLAPHRLTQELDLIERVTG